MKKYILIILLLQIIMEPAIGKVIPASLIGDNMILQQRTKVKLWGKAKPNTRIKVSPSWDKKSYSGISDADGGWLIEVYTPEASYTSHSLTFYDGEKTTISNILIGEVWFAGGQSNMEMPLKGFGNCPVKGSLEAIVGADNHPQIRMFNVPRKHSGEPLNDINGQWAVASSETAGRFSAVAYFFALSLNRSLDVPIGIINCSVGGSKVEGWTSREILRNYPDVKLDREVMEKIPDYLRPMVFYNAMLHPIVPYTIKGFIWYQGESNVGSRDYALRMTNMIKQWRDEWGLGEIPFYYVEIAPFLYQGHQKGKAPYLREEQCKVQHLVSNCGMVSTNDLVDPYEADNVHPCNKEQIGKRLSYLALNETYGKKHISCHSPEYREMELKGNKIKVTFSHADMGYSRNRGIQGFEVAGDDRIFYPADKIERQSNGLLISSDKVPRPQAVRYCFKDFQPGNLGGVNGLPVIPFRTDNW